VSADTAAMLLIASGGVGDALIAEVGRENVVDGANAAVGAARARPMNARDFE